MFAITFERITNLRSAMLALFVLILALALALAFGDVHAQGINLNAQVLPGTPVTPGITGTGDGSAGIYFGTHRTGISGHLESGLGTGDLPALSSCGTSPALATGSTDTAGKITVGTSASAACTLTFGTAYAVAPFCVYQNMTTGAPANVATVSASAIVWSSVLADSTVLTYHCTAASGG